jgi:hypothetical protein
LFGSRHDPMRSRSRSGEYTQNLARRKPGGEEAVLLRKSFDNVPACPIRADVTS